MLQTFPIWCIASGLALASAALAQSTIGTVRTDGASVQGVVAVKGGRATLQNNGTVAAGPQASDVDLSRGGTVKVCAGSTVSFSQSMAPRTASPLARTALLIALQQGAAEIRTGVQRSDAVLTPDLRIEMSDSTSLDLHLRMNSNGDTCVENLGKDAPMLHVTEQFGGAGYLVKPGQRVLFEHGSVREVVDREGTNCGCPRNGKGGKDDFPEAISAGLVKPEVPSVPAGETHAQVSTGMDYNGATAAATGPPAYGGTAPPVTTRTEASQPSTTASPAPSQKKTSTSGGPFHAIARFFRRLFGAG